MSSEEEVQKKNENRKNRSEGYKKLWVLVIVVGVISIIMLFFYFLRFNNGLSYDSNNWAAFGSYFGSVTGLLAFAGVLYSSHLSEKRAEEAEARLEQQEEESRKRYVEDSERAIFFQLLELHNKKFLSITYKSYNQIINEKECSENDAFKCFIRKFNAYVKIYIVLSDVIRFDTLNELQQTYNDERINRDTHSLGLNDNFTKHKKLISDYLKDQKFNSISYTDYNYKDWVSIKWAKMSVSEKIEALKYGYDYIYKEYGHILGHYFRNMYYIFDTIDNFRGGDYNDEYNKQYAKLFRAQLSRFEIALIICNAVSSQSTSKVITLLEKYQILNGYYNQDLFFTADILNNSINNSEKDEGKIIVDEILAEAKKQFSNGK